MPENRVSASLSQADLQAVLAAIQTIRDKLPFLIDLTPDERRAMPKIGDTGHNFAAQALTIATQNLDLLPRAFDLAEFQRDVELLAALRPLVAAVTQLQELIEDTYLQVGSEAYVSALAVYGYAKAGNKGAALDSLLADMKRRFTRKTSKSSTSTTPADGK
jgi:hypothetical protein